MYNNEFMIFISHDGRDHRVASELRSFLEIVFPHVNVYVSADSVEGGRVWIEDLKNRLKESRVIISLLTSKSLKSNWVYFESGVGFPDSKTIPLLTDNLKHENLTPPMSLLQTRMFTAPGIRELIVDISNKLKQRVPPDNQKTGNLVDKIEKLLRSENAHLLEKRVPRQVYAPTCHKQWIYQDNCVVFDYLVEDEQISVDIYFYIDCTEIQLFPREGSEEFFSETLGRVDDFLPGAFNSYEKKGNRLIYKRFDSSASVEAVAESLTELLKRIELLRNKTLKGVNSDDSSWL